MFPIFGLQADAGEHLAIGLAFIGVSLARSFALRRLFEADPGRGRVMPATRTKLSFGLGGLCSEFVFARSSRNT